MLENLSETSEVTNVFYSSSEEDSVAEQPEAEEEESSEIVDDLEELADEDADDTEEDEDQVESIDAFGTEITREEFDTMKDQQLMHADYTKKTQALADKTKQIEALNSDLAASISEFESLIVREESDEELAELKEDDYVEWLRRMESIKEKKAKLASAKSKQGDALAAVQAEENQKLISVMTEWSDPKKGQDTQKSDVDAAIKYAGEIGYSNEDLNKLADHKVIRALIDAGKYRELKSKPAASKRKTIASKKVNGKKVVQSKTKSTAELFYGAK